ncbi:MAG: hypothetical protein FD126_2977, partial [Elusimicrobia bacterium]
ERRVYFLVSDWKLEPLRKSAAELRRHAAR